MKKSLQIASVAMLALAFSGTAVAKTVTPEEALARAISQPSGSKMKKPARYGETKLALSLSASEVDKTPMVYVFSKGSDNGYLVTPADDQFPAILGYSDTGSFSEADMPPAMKWWLSEYAKEMEYAINKNSESKVKRLVAFSEENWESVEPLLKSKWDQSAPYNNMSPTLDLEDGTVFSTTVTGCVATSMAQVMYYHKWPDVGVGSNSYDWQPYTDVIKKTLSCDFSKVEFDWDNMLDVYEKEKYTDVQGNAVAELMYACGISVNMKYNMSSAGGSGAQSSKQHIALSENFKYSKNIRYKERNYCSSKEWEQTIYDNLQQKLPVLYNGHGDGGGHSFVCDGYAGNHYFHFNWGWSGMSDGYFLLCRLNPDDLGIGGANGGFNYVQGITYNIYPEKEGEEIAKIEPLFTCQGDFAYSQDKQSQSSGGQTLTYCYFSGGFYNSSDLPYSGCLGVILENLETSELSSYIGLIPNNLMYNYGYKELPVYLEEVEEGTYKVYPALSYATDDYRLSKMTVANGCNDYLILHVDADGKRTFSSPVTKDADNAPDLMATLFTYKGQVYTDAPSTYTMMFANVSKDVDYYGSLTMQVSEKGGDVVGEMPFDFDIPAGLSLPFSASINIPLPAGEYEVSFMDDYGRELPGIFPLVISEGSAGSVTHQDLKLIGFSPVDLKPSADEKDLVKFTFTVKNESDKVIEQPYITLFLWDSTSDTSVFGRSWKWNVSMDPGDTWNLGGQVALTYNANKEVPLPAGEYRARIRREYTDENGNAKSAYLSQFFTITIGHPVESVSMSTGNHSMKVGEKHTLTAEILPEHATFKTLSWTSSNPSAVTVDNKGNIEAKEEGTSYVVATSPNGMFDVCEVAVGTETSVEDIFGEVSEVIAVYSVSGVKILDRPSAEEVKALEKGVYVVVTDKGSYKLAR